MESLKLAVQKTHLLLSPGKAIAVAVEAEVGAGKAARSRAAYVITATPAQASIGVGDRASPSGEVAGSTNLRIRGYEELLRDGCSVKVGKSFDFTSPGPLLDGSSISEEREKGYKNIAGLHFAKWEAF